MISAQINKAPALFVSHGPPFVALAECPANSFLRGLGRRLSMPRAIISISAHWESVDPLVTNAADPEIIYDFTGPQSLKNTAYNLRGAPSLAADMLQVLHAEGFDARGMARGFDHGTWIPLMLMYPDADIPTVQLSIQTEEDPSHHYRLGKALAPLRESGVLIMASGGAVHNLDEVHHHTSDAEPPHYVHQFDRWLEKQILGGHTADLLDYQHKAPQPLRCHPYPAEHFLPLFVALGAATGEKGRRLHDSFLFGTLSMAAYAWG